MANIEEKINKFVQANTTYSDEQRDMMLREAEEYKAERPKKAAQADLVAAYTLIQKETGDIRTERAREMSRRDLAARKEVLNRRRQIMDEVFSKAEVRLSEYAETPGYLDFLKNTLGRMTQLLPSAGTVYTVAERDRPLIDELSKICPSGSRVEAADTIKLGGIRAVNSESGQIIDNTLDSRLQSQREWFTISSGLTAG